MITPVPIKKRVIMGEEDTRKGLRYLVLDANDRGELFLNCLEDGYIVDLKAFKQALADAETNPLRYIIAPVSEDDTA